MKLLVDTHVFFWWLTEDRHLTAAARRALEDVGNQVVISAVVAWEIATKTRIGKWAEAEVIVNDIENVIAARGFEPLSISIAHARLAGLMPGDHRDPFDRLLSAQAEIENVPLVTSDRAFRRFGTRTLW